MPDGHVDSASMPTLPHAARVMRVLDEFLRRRAAGEPVSEAALLAAHPDLADELRGHLEIVTHLQPADQHIADLIAKGILQYSTDARFAAALGPYQILGLIGRGGMGIVLRVYEPSLNRTVALKILRPDLSHDGTAVTRFQREARAAAALRSPHIVTIHAIGQERGVHYIAMEHVDGPSLADLIRRQGPLPAELVRHVFRGMLEALRAAHEAGLIHRDIKSSNILLGSLQPSAVSSQPEPAGDASSASDPSSLRGFVASSLPTVKLADFGLARMRASQTQVTVDGSVLGTPEYMSPEQARGDVDIDHRTDLYSAGVVLYEMLTGRTPFHADTPTATIRKILDERPRDPRELDRHVDPVLASLALRLMEKKREDRVPSAKAALNVLGARRPMYSPARYRAMCRRSAAGIVLLGLCAVAWPLLTAVLKHPKIEAVRIDPEGHQTVQVQYGDDTSWKKFPAQFPAGSKATLNCAVIADVDGRGRQIVVVGSVDPLNGENSTIIAFDCLGEPRWRLSPRQDLNWPDTDSQKTWWSVWSLAVGDLDRAPGDELVVAASDPGDYPACVSVIDPRNGEIRRMFLHFGQIQEVRVLPGHLEHERAAIFARGWNNKLDGFNDGLREGERQWARWDTVQVAMVLDPERMDGLGPPELNSERLAQFGSSTNKVPAVWAYGFLDCPTNDDSLRVLPASPLMKATWRGWLVDEFAAEIREIHTQAGAGFELSIRVDSADRNRVADVGLQLGRTLELTKVVVPPHNDAQGLLGIDLEFWAQYWRSIIQGGKYIDE